MLWFFFSCCNGPSDKNIPHQTSNPRRADFNNSIGDIFEESIIVNLMTMMIEFTDDQIFFLEFLVFVKCSLRILRGFTQRLQNESLISNSNINFLRDHINNLLRYQTFYFYRGG
jgi:hypothetical protein